MRADIVSWCRECQICAAHRVGHPVRPLLTPIPVAGPFDQVGVDLLEMTQRMASVWECARQRISKAQKKHKQQHDRKAKDPGFQVGERVFVGEAYKFAKKFQGPFCIMAMYDNGVELRDVNKPRSKHVRVALNRVRRCPKEVKDLTEEMMSEKVSDEVAKDDEESESTISGKPEKILLGRTI